MDILNGLPWYLQAVLLVYLVPSMVLWFYALIEGWK